MSLAFSSAGSGPPMVLLHGLFGSGDNLRGLGRAFEADHTVYYPDLPNHGDSPHTQSVDYAGARDAVAGFLRDQGALPAVLVGHSMGGKVAMRVALDRPELVASLVVLDMAPRRYQSSHAGIMDAMLALAVDEVESRADADRRLSAAIPSPPVRSFLLKNLVKDDNGYRWRLNLSLLRREYETILGWDAEGCFRGPTLIVGGTASGYVRPERDADLVSRSFPHSRIAMIEGAGHWIHSERQDDVQRLVREFLEQSDANGRSDATT